MRVNEGKENKNYERLVAARRREPLCERCRKRQAEYITTTGDEYPQATRNKWEFRCRKCTPKAENCYYFTIDNLLRSSVGFDDWMKHLSDKIWFDDPGFTTMLARFESSGIADASEQET